MARSNYDITLSRMREKFLEYDQEAMIEKFHLRHDSGYLYLRYLDYVCRIDRTTGLVQLCPQDGSFTDAGFNEGMTVYDVLCCSRAGCRPSGRFAPVNRLPKSFHSSGLGESLFQEYADFFDSRTDRLCAACRRLGGTEAGKGDAAFQLPLFDFLPVRLQFWQSDEEFPASLQLLWDENTLDFIHYETTYYAAGSLLDRLKQLASNS